MGDQPVVVAVASYPTRVAADADFAALWSLQSMTGRDHLTAALLEKGTSGELELQFHRNTAAGLAWGVALLGGALTTLAAPVGISYLASGLSSSAEWAGAAVIVGRFWHQIPRDKLRSMSNLVEAGQAGLVVVAVAHDTEEVVARLSGASSRVLSDSMQVDLMADFGQAIAGL
jgi:hypothetical protein